MKAVRIAVFALASVAVISSAWARPALVAPIRLSVPPLASESGPYTVYQSLAIDGDTLLVSTMQYASPSDVREAVHIFERAASGSWNYAGVLIEGHTFSFHLHGGLAAVGTADEILVYERTPQGWSRTGSIAGSHSVVRVENGAIYSRRYRPPGGTVCTRADWVLRKVGSQWTQVATVGAPNCGDETVQPADINDGRAIVVRQAVDLNMPQPPAEIFADSGAASWPRVAMMPAPPGEYFAARWGTITSQWAYVHPANLFRNTLASTAGNNWVSLGKLAQPEIELESQPGYARLRGDTLVIPGGEHDYELPTLDDYEVPIQWGTLRVYRARASGFFDYHARLNIDFSVYTWTVSDDGRRVAATSADNNYYGEATRLYVFEIPDTVTFAGTQQDTFESNNFSRWTPTAGSFAIATNGASRVMRQTSVAGDAGAYLTAFDWQDQSIEADLRPLEYSGNDRWFGLVARRVDARNFYYVTFRSSGTISLRRMRDGVVTELAYTYIPPPFAVGRSYRVRLEAVGDQLAVMVDGIPRLHVKDTSFTHGHPGVAGYRTRFEVDNVIVSPATRLLVRLETPERQWWAYAPADLSTGEWAHAYDAGVNNWIMRQSANAGDARWFSRTAIGNQVVSARMRPMSYGATTGTQDPWVGIAAHVVDERNYYYLTLRRSNQVSLRRVVNGQVQVLATVPQSVTTGAWYDLRLELIGTNIRAFVNGDLKIQTTDPTRSGGGRNALLMYKTAADTFSWVAYQP